MHKDDAEYNKLVFTSPRMSISSIVPPSKGYRKDMWVSKAELS